MHICRFLVSASLASIVACSGGDQPQTNSERGGNAATSEEILDPDYEFLRRIADNLGTLADLTLTASRSGGPDTEFYHALHEERSGQRAEATGLIRTIFEVEYLDSGSRRSVSEQAPQEAVEAEHRAGLEIVKDFSGKLKHPEVLDFAARIEGSYTQPLSAGTRRKTSE